MKVPAAEKQGVPTDRTLAFQKAATASGGDDAERIVHLLRSWDTDGDGMFSVQEVLSAARQMMSERKTNRRLLWVIAGVAVLYVLTVAVLLGITVGAVELAKDAKPDENGNMINLHGAKDVVHTKAKTDVASPFDFVTQSLADLEQIDALYIDDLLTKEGKTIERYYKVMTVSRSKDDGSVKVEFFGGDYLEVDKERALLFRPKPESGCGAEAEGFEAPEGFCPVAEIINGADPRDAEASGEPDARRLLRDGRQLQARTSIVGPAYNTGPRGVGGNINFNTGRIYGSDGIVSLGRSRFFGQGQFRSCNGPACSF